MAKSNSFSGLFIMLLVVLATAQMMMPKGAEARRQCSKWLDIGTCNIVKCSRACTSNHGREASGHCVRDEIGTDLSCQCQWSC
ncbi:hypothetical protein SAY87_002328 [Trapa incisa]|uniref:Uncharacterized protein n=1 Tax=Trapa incisa TaxID=236973 RepID=A0AAN7JUC6_9MYRT|nr:hypothetical protein SAY87_002328 [Trapa incisa]